MQTNILEVMQMFSAAWRAFSAVKIVTCFYKPRIVPQEECRRELGSQSKSDVGMVTNWQHLCQKLHFEAELDDSLHVGNDATAAEEVRGGNVVSEVLMERNGESGNHVTPQENREDNGDD
jgi:hypothetical protein